MWKKLAELDASQQVLKSSIVPPTPRAHWSTWVFVSLAILGFIATFVMYVAR
jgi:hypothetical protein